MSVIIFIIILAVLVLVHEFGHFFTAKKFGVRVDEFGLGFPPRMIGKKIGETIYSINWIPFGGFVKIFGENPDEESIAGVDSGRSFVKIAKWKQVIVLASGVLMNIVFAWLLFSISYMSGMTTIISDANAAYTTDSHVIILGIAPKSPALAGGLMAGDRILGISGGAVVGGAKNATTTISDVATVQNIIKDSKGKPVIFTIQRDANEKIVSVTPEMSDTDHKYVVGISMDLAGKVQLPIHKAIWEGAKLAGSTFVGIAKNIYTLAHDAILGQADLSQVSGPVGIARLVGDAQKLGFVYLLSFAAFISLNLAVLNLIPFPALDGGRILFVIIEAIKRSPIRPNIANTVNAIGFGLLILLMLFITYRDIAKLF